MSHANFAAVLAERCGRHARLLRAEDGESVGADGLGAHIARAGGAFSRLALTPGDRVLIAADLSPAAALAYLGALHAGLVAVPLDTATLRDGVGPLAAATGARALWTPTDRAGPVRGTAGLVRLAGRLNAPPTAPTERDRDDLAALMATSGSSGRPRLVRVTHGNLLANTAAIADALRLTAADRALLVLPLHYCFGASVLHTLLHAGGSIVFDRRLMFPDKVLTALRDQGCTTFAGVPTVYRLLLRRSGLGSRPLPQLRRFLQAGGPLSPEDIDAVRAAVPHAEFHVMYGQTEATARIAMLEPSLLAAKRGSVGRPLDGLRTRIVGDDGHLVTPGSVGELLVSGASVCPGYWDDPEADRARWVGGWLRTGDLVRADADGYLWVEGRRGDFAKVRGVRLAFGEVEALVGGVPGVEAVGACAVPHEEAGEALALFVVPRSPGDADALPQAVRRALPKTWTCGEVRVVADLPHTSSGKLARAALSRLAGVH